MRLAALALLLVTPGALAVDLLPSEAKLGETEARILVRSTEGLVSVRTEPSVLVAAAPPEGPPGEFVPSPRALEAAHVWRGIDHMVEVVLRRDDERAAVDVVVEDGSGTGVWFEWPGVEREMPTPLPLIAFVLAALVAGRTRLAAEEQKLTRPRP